MMNSRRKQGGFVLLMVLIVVVLAGTAMVGMARRSMLKAVDVKARSRQLQRKWAVRSMQDSLLPRVGLILHHRPGPTGGADSFSTDQVRVAVRLSGGEYQLVMTDEQARLNVNVLLADNTPGQVETTLRRLIEQPGHELRLRTVSETQLRQNPSLGVRAGGYGQIFPSAKPGDLLGLDRNAGLADRITCWGDGKLNLSRAHRRTVRALCTRALSRPIVEGLLAARDEQPRGDLGKWIGSLDQISRREAHEIRQWLTDQSGCFGLWIVTGNGRRKWYHFAVGHSPEARSDPATPDGQGARQTGIRGVKVFSW